MILTEDECFAALADDITEIEETRACEEEWAVIVAMCRAIEAAVIAKLSQGVEMPEPCIYESDASPLYDAPSGYTADQLQIAIAAARVKALEDAAALAEHENAADWSISGQIARQIRTLKGGAA